MQIKIIGHPKSYASIIENDSTHAEPCAEKVIAYDLGCPFLFTVHIVKYTKMQIKKIVHPKSYASDIANDSTHAEPCADKVIAYDLGCPTFFI